MTEPTAPQSDRPAGGGGERRERSGPPPRGGGRPGGGDRGDRGGGRDAGGPRRFQKRFHRGKVCQFCVDKSIYVDYKDLERLARFVSHSGKILPRRMTGTCSRHMRMLTRALKRARMMALLPFSAR
jgi:small subunit ribosomal protein S18